MVVNFGNSSLTGRDLEAKARFAALAAIWRDQCGGQTYPNADELFVTDFPELMPYCLSARLDAPDEVLIVDLCGDEARRVLGCDPIGTRPELAEADAPLAWIGAGYAVARRLVGPGPVTLHHGRRTALHLPYVARGGKSVRTILTLLAIDMPQDNFGPPLGKVITLRPG